MKRGNAQVFDGGSKILDMSGNLPKSKRKIKMTKAQFVEAWNKTYEAGRKRLMETVIPVQ